MEKENIKNRLELVKELLESISGIDEEIKSIHEIAQQAAMDRCELTFSIGIKNHTKEAQKKENILDEDGYVSIHLSENSEGVTYKFSNIPYFGGPDSKNKETPKNTTQFTFTDKDCLEVLSVLLSIKTNERNKIIKQAKNIGL